MLEAAQLSTLSVLLGVLINLEITSADMEIYLLDLAPAPREDRCTNKPKLGDRPLPVAPAAFAGPVFNF